MSVNETYMHNFIVNSSNNNVCKKEKCVECWGALNYLNTAQITGSERILYCTDPQCGRFGINTYAWIEINEEGE